MSSVNSTSSPESNFSRICKQEVCVWTWNTNVLIFIRRYSAYVVYIMSVFMWVMVAVMLFTTKVSFQNFLSPTQAKQVRVSSLLDRGQENPNVSKTAVVSDISCGWSEWEKEEGEEVERVQWLALFKTVCDQMTHMLTKLWHIRQQASEWEGCILYRTHPQIPSALYSRLHILAQQRPVSTTFSTIYKYPGSFTWTMA